MIFFSDNHGSLIPQIFRCSLMLGNCDTASIEKSQALIPHLMNTLNNSGTDPPELTLRALKFCLQRANCDASCDVIKDLQQVLVATEGLNVTSSHQVVILVLAYYYACQLAGKDYKDVLNMSEASPILANIFDSITEDKIELYLQRLLTLNGWNQETNVKVSCLCSF